MSPSDSHNDAPYFTRYVDLASETLGSKPLLASDEWRGRTSFLLSATDPVTDPDAPKGWLTRRQREEGPDWCLLQLGVPGVVRGVDIDTRGFEGNSPTHASIDLCNVSTQLDLITFPPESALWQEILPKTALQADAHNFIEIPEVEDRWTHVRLNTYPDGGVARFRFYGLVQRDWTQSDPNAEIDLASVLSGGHAMACSDMLFGGMHNLIQAEPPQIVRTGWETRRRRDGGHDWVIIKLGSPGTIRRLEVDTMFYDGNHPDACSVDQCYLPNATLEQLFDAGTKWTSVVGKELLRPNHPHLFEREVKIRKPATHVRLNIFPDGGVSRFRVWGVRKT